MADNFLEDDIFSDLDDLDDESEGTPEDVEVEDQEDVVEKEPASPAGKDETKAFSERLKKEKEKLAKQLGYDSWEDALEKRTNTALLDQGIDPDTVKPILKDLLKNDPDYIAAMEYKKDKEELEKKLWAETELKKLNDKFGLSISDINQLDKAVIDLWNGGLTLEKAYAAEHYEELRNAAARRGANKQSGKDHLTDPSKGGGADKVKRATAEEIRMFKKFNPGVSDDEIHKFINKK